MNYEMEHSTEKSQNEEYNHSIRLKAVVDGEIIPIETMEDPVFSQKMIGDGYGIIPNTSSILSPVNGKLVEVARTKHAYSIQVERGIKVFIHVGKNTLMLNGEGFTSNVEVDTEIQEGELLGTFDKEFLNEKGYEPVISVIVLYNEDVPFDIETYKNKNANAGSTIASVLKY